MREEKAFFLGMRSKSKAEREREKRIFVRVFVPSCLVHFGTGGGGGAPFAFYCILDFFCEGNPMKVSRKSFGAPELLTYQGKS